MIEQLVYHIDQRDGGAHQRDNVIQEVRLADGTAQRTHMVSMDNVDVESICLTLTS